MQGTVGPHDGTDHGQLRNPLPMGGRPVIHGRSGPGPWVGEIPPQLGYSTLGTNVPDTNLPEIGVGVEVVSSQAGRSGHDFRCASRASVVQDGSPEVSLDVPTGNHSNNVSFERLVVGEIWRQQQLYSPGSSLSANRIPVEQSLSVLTDAHRNSLIQGVYSVNHLR